MFKQDINIVINSNKDIFIFRLSDEREIVYNIYNSRLMSVDSNSLDEKKVLKYAICIDENDVIHLVSLLSSGDFNYHIYNNKVWVKMNIAKFNMKSNLYNQIEILMIQSKLHIIYNYSNLVNSNVWTIQHVVYNSDEKHNAIRYLSKRIPDPFTLDVDSQGNIHLLYRNNIANPQICHSFYNPYKKSWTSNYKSFSSDYGTSLIPILFIDPQDNLHALWLEKLESKYQVKYMKMSFSGKEKYIWKEVNLPYTKSSNYPPIIFEEDNKLKLVFISDDNIDFLYSTNYGDSWVKSFMPKNIDKNIILVKAKSNLNKINHIYCNLENMPKLWFLDFILDNANFSDYKNLTLEQENMQAMDTQTIELKNVEIEAEKIYAIYNSIESILNQILNNQENIKLKLQDMQSSIDFKKTNFFQRFFK